jgi:hypothetical protein
VQGTNIIVQNGVAAGQKAQHFMVHVIPRQEGDGLVFDVPQKQMKEEELEVVRKKLAAHLGQKNEVPGLQPVQKAPVAERQAAETEEPDIEEPPEIEIDHEREIPSQPVEEADDEPEEEEPDDSNEQDESDDNEEGVDLDDISRMLGNG